MRPKTYLRCCGVLLLVLPACSGSDHTVGGSGGASGAPTCAYQGKTYQVGDTFYDDCRYCMCLVDGNTARVGCSYSLCLDGGPPPTSGGAPGAGGVSGSGGAVGGAAGGKTGTSGGDRWPDGSPTPDAANCDELSAAARAQYQSSLTGMASLACQVDSDCFFFFPPQARYCFTTCGDVVGEADIPALEAATAGVCDPYWAAGCPQVWAPPCVPEVSICDRGHCVRGWPVSVDAAAGGSPGGAVDGGVSGTGGASASDGGGTIDSGVSSACVACGSDELCVGYYDGTCTAMSSHCVKVSAATRESILVKHERCFMKPIGDEICGNRDGGVFWGCGEPPCPNEPLVSDINCYGP